MVMEWSSQDIYQKKSEKLYEPSLCGMKMGVWSFYIAVTFIVEDILQLYGAFINFHGYKDDLTIKIDELMTLVIRIPEILAALFLIYGIAKKKSTPIAVFLYLILEIFFVYITYYAYKGLTDKLEKFEMYTMYPIAGIKAILWWLVNMYHNHLKDKEYCYRYQSSNVSEV